MVRRNNEGYVSSVILATKASVFQPAPRKPHGGCERRTPGSTTEDINRGIGNTEGRRKADKEDGITEVRNLSNSLVIASDW